MRGSGSVGARPVTEVPVPAGRLRPGIRDGPERHVLPDARLVGGHRDPHGRRRQTWRAGPRSRRRLLWLSVARTRFRAVGGAVALARVVLGDLLHAAVEPDHPGVLARR